MAQNNHIKIASTRNGWPTPEARAGSMTKRNRLPSPESHDHGPHGAGRSRSVGLILASTRVLPKTPDDSPTASVDAREFASVSFEILPHPPYLLAALQHLGHTTLHSKLGCRQGQARQGNAVNGFGRSDMNPAATTTQGGSELPHENSSLGSRPDRRDC